jgi:hypothetical protein
MRGAQLVLGIGCLGVAACGGGTSPSASHDFIRSSHQLIAAINAGDSDVTASLLAPRVVIAINGTTRTFSAPKAGRALASATCAFDVADALEGTGYGGVPVITLTASITDSGHPNCRNAGAAVTVIVTYDTHGLITRTLINDA